MVTIRRVGLADCWGIAEVQVDSYRAAYAPFFPAEVLARFSYEEQAADWAAWLGAHPDDDLFVAVSEDQRIAGYVLARAERDIHPGYDGEILALHVRGTAQGQGTGTALLRAAVGALVQRGCASVMLWTLAGNPVRRWYVSLGGRLLAEKRYDVEGTEVVEEACGWPEIGTLARGVEARRA